MDNVLIPEWIKEINARSEEKARSIREIALAESLLRAKVPVAWEEFIREFRIQREGCNTLREVSTTTFDDVSQTNPPDKAFKLSIFGSSPFGPLLSTAVRLKVEHGHPHIECLREDNEKDFKIFFHLTPLGEVLFLTDRESTAQMAAEYVVKKMIRDLGIDISA